LAFEAQVWLVEHFDHGTWDAAFQGRWRKAREAFYKGDIARKIVAFQKESGGLALAYWSPG